MTIQCASGGRCAAYTNHEILSDLLAERSLDTLCFLRVTSCFRNKPVSSTKAENDTRVGDILFTPHTYPAALLLMILSMLCWGSWANTQKIDHAWRFELFYLDYTFGLLIASFLFALTFGHTDPTSADSFFANLHSANTRSIVEAFLG